MRRNLWHLIAKVLLAHDGLEERKKSLMTNTNGSGDAGSVVVQPDQAKVGNAGESAGANSQTSNTTTTDQASTATVENQQGAESRPRKGGFQRKIEKLTQEAEFWREQALKNPQKQSDSRETRPTEEKVPKLDDFDSYDEYVRADARYQARQEVKKTLDERDQTARHESLKAEKAKRIEGYHERENTARERYADFDDVVSGSDAPMTEAMRDAVLESDMGPEVVYYLAQNPEKAAAMTKMGVTALNREVGRIEAMIEKQPSESEAAPQNSDKRPTKAPAPIKAVNTGTAKTGETYRKDMSQQEFNAMRARQEAARRERAGR